VKRRPSRGFKRRRGAPSWLWWALAAVLFAGVYVALTIAGFDVNSIAAFASAIAAFMSLRSARESSDTARNALRALSYASKPELEIDYNDGGMGTEGVALNITNVGIYDAEDLIVEWKLRDGTKGREMRKSIPGTGRSGGPTRGRARIEAGNAGQTNGEDSFVVTYRGPMGPTRWRLETTWNIEHSTGALPDGTATSGYSRGRTVLTDEEVL